MTLGNDEAGKDSGAKPEGEGETELSAGKEVEAPSRGGETDLSVEYIIPFAKAVELYQKKNRNCLGCGSSDHLVQNWPKDLSRSALKVDLNTKEGMAKNKPVAAQQASLGKMPQG